MFNTVEVKFEVYKQWVLGEGWQNFGNLCYDNM
jgi:hypothetical protein